MFRYFWQKVLVFNKMKGSKKSFSFETRRIQAPLPGGRIRFRLVE